jgi:hypothetical protein
MTVSCLVCEHILLHDEQGELNVVLFKLFPAVGGENYRAVARKIEIIRINFIHNEALTQ